MGRNRNRNTAELKTTVVSTPYRLIDSSDCFSAAFRTERVNSKPIVHQSAILASLTVTAGAIGGTEGRTKDADKGSQIISHIIVRTGSRSRWSFWDFAMRWPAVLLLRPAEEV